jgi:hypothetical protein
MRSEPYPPVLSASPPFQYCKPLRFSISPPGRSFLYYVGASAVNLCAYVGGVARRLATSILERTIHPIQRSYFKYDFPRKTYRLRGFSPNMPPPSKNAPHVWTEVSSISRMLHTCEGSDEHEFFSSEKWDGVWHSRSQKWGGDFWFLRCLGKRWKRKIDLR